MLNTLDLWPKAQRMKNQCNNMVTTRIVFAKSKKQNKCMQLRVSVVVGLNESALHFQLKLHTCKLLQCDFAHIFLIAKAVIDAV